MGALRVAALLLLIPFCSAAGQTNALLVDTSKSMRPYYDAGLMKELNNLIYEVLQPKGGIALYGFSTGVSEASGIDALSHPELGDWTYLDRAIDFALGGHYGTAWLVTDNVQSQSSDPEAANTASFYQKLRSPQIRKIIVFPLRQTPGRAGLMVYALELAPESDAAFTSQVSEFRSRTSDKYHTQLLQMKPLDSNTVELNFVKGNAGNTIKSTKEYKVGQNINEEFQANFKSKFEHLKIADAKVEVPSAKPIFSESSLLTSEKREIDIDPKRVVSLDPQSESETYAVKVDLGTISLKRDPASLWKAAWGKNYEEITLDLLFVVRVGQEGFKFKDSFIRDYSAATPEAAKASGKIYGMDQLPILLSDVNTAISARNSVGFKVRYGWGPAVIWFVVFSLVGLVLFGLVVIARRSLGSLKSGTIWKVTAATVQGVPLRSECDGERVSVQGDSVGTVEKGKFFVSTPGVKLDGGAERARIQQGVPLKIEWKERLILLTFQQAEGQQTQGGPPGSTKRGSGYTPRKR
jgi:hypothetical protein